MNVLDFVDKYGRLVLSHKFILARVPCGLKSEFKATLECETPVYICGFGETISEAIQNFSRQMSGRKLFINNELVEVPELIYEERDFVWETQHIITW